MQTLAPAEREAVLRVVAANRTRPGALIEILHGVQAELGFTLATPYQKQGFATEAVGACILWLVTGISVGVLAALKRGRWQDRLATGAALVGYSFPTFFIGLVLQYFVFFKFGIMDSAQAKVGSSSSPRSR